MNMTRIVTASLAGLLSMSVATAASVQGGLQERGGTRLQAGQQTTRAATDASRATVARNASAADGQRIDEINATIATLDNLISAPVPGRLSAADKTAWNEHTAWLTSVRDRYRNLVKGVASAGSSVAGAVIPGGNVLQNATSGAPGGGSGEPTGTAPSGASMMADMTQMNMEFMSLQQSVQTESRKYQTLSNAIKARHDTAMNSIRNMK